MASHLRFQYHLSTGIILMFGAAMLLWLNMRPMRLLATEDVAYFGYGWPFQCKLGHTFSHPEEWSVVKSGPPPGIQNRVRVRSANSGRQYLVPTENCFMVGKLTANAVFGVSILALGGWAIERLEMYRLYRLRRP